MTGEYRLYMELIFAGAVLLTILFANNIFLYKQKITDYISLMMIAGVFVCIFEILWALLDGNPNLRALSYITASCYSIAFLIFGVLMNRYCMDRFNLHPGRVGITIAYILPVAAFTLLCISTPWTKLVFWVDENGIIQEMVLFDYLFQILLYFYIFSPLLLAIYYLTVGKKRRPEGAEIPVSLFVFGVIAPVLYWLEQLFLGEELNPYVTMTLPIALALMYLITNVSTHTALDTRARIEAVETDLAIASRIQTGALPPVSPEFAEHGDVNLRCSMKTAKEVGGDFYDYFAIDDKRICFLVADVSGKGTPAALFMMTAKTIIRDYALACDNTSEIFAGANARMCESNDQNMFATSWIGILDTQTMTLQYTNAGHNYPILLKKGKPCEEIKGAHAMALAGFDFTEYEQDEIRLEEGDRLFLYTDGVTEAHNGDNNLYGTGRLEKVLDESRDSSGEQVMDNVFTDIEVFAEGSPQFDDITMVVLTIK